MCFRGTWTQWSSGRVTHVTTADLGLKVILGSMTFGIHILLCIFKSNIYNDCISMWSRKQARLVVREPPCILLVIFKWLLNLLECLIYHTIKDKKVCLHLVWIRLKTAYLLCAWEFTHNNAPSLQFWYLSNALTLRVRALDASKSQHACIILSKFTRKSKYAVTNL